MHECFVPFDTLPSLKEGEDVKRLRSFFLIRGLSSAIVVIFGGWVIFNAKNSSLEG